MRWLPRFLSSWHWHKTLWWRQCWKALGMPSFSSNFFSSILLGILLPPLVSSSIFFPWLIFYFLLNEIASHELGRGIFLNTIFFFSFEPLIIVPYLFLFYWGHLHNSTKTKNAEIILPCKYHQVRTWKIKLKRLKNYTRHKVVEWTKFSKFRFNN